MKVRAYLPLAVGLAVVCVVAALWWRSDHGRDRQQGGGVPPAKSSVVASRPQARPSARPEPRATDTRMFRDLDVLQRNAILESVKRLGVHALFDEFLAAGRAGDLMKQSALMTVLGYSMREQEPSADFLAQLGAFVADRANPVLEREMVLASLANASTKSSLALLLGQLDALEPSVRHVALLALKNAGGLWGDGKFHDERTEPLSGAWRAATDRQALGSLATAMAAVGSEDGIALLVASARDQSANTEERREAARVALAHAAIVNPAAVKPLKQALVREDPTSEMAQLLVGVLSRMPFDAAGTALLEWFRTVGDNGAPLASLAVLGSRTPEMQSVWKRAVTDRNDAFRSESVRAAIREGIRKTDASITYEIP